MPLSNPKKRENQSDSLLLEYHIPIKSSAELDGDFMIEGIAINETTTSNGHKFIAEELRSSANTLIGVPLLKDHNNSVDSIVGKVKLASFNESDRNIPFKAVVKDAKMKQMINDGLLNSVSVGAHVNPTDIEELENGEIVPHNIQFKELSLVAVPADGQATFGVALNNAWGNLKSKAKLEESDEVEDNSHSTERRNDDMTEEKTTEVSESNEVLNLLNKMNDSMTEMKERLSKLEESDKDETPEKPEDKPEEPEKPEEKSEEEEVEEEETEDVEESGDYVLKQGYNSFELTRKSYNY